ncbi:MAG TPA: hypothetical protein VK420_06480 [Longimicrobium sp.]|nr:hypothetical protein [Longimicrobium sp.]
MKAGLLVLVLPWALLAGSCANRVQGCIGFVPSCDGDIAQRRCDVRCTDRNGTLLLYECHTIIQDVDCRERGQICRGKGACIDPSETPCDPKWPMAWCDPKDKYAQSICVDTGGGEGYVRTARAPKGQVCIEDARLVNDPPVTCDRNKHRMTCKGNVLTQCLPGSAQSGKWYLVNATCEHGCQDGRGCLPGRGR